MRKNSAIISKTIYIVATCLILAGVVLRLNEYKIWYLLTSTGTIMGLAVLLYSVSKSEKKTES
jgi:hypothetical protein